MADLQRQQLIGDGQAWLYRSCGTLEPAPRLLRQLGEWSPVVDMRHDGDVSQS
jgi:hypothetical protein